MAAGEAFTYDLCGERDVGCAGTAFQEVGLGDAESGVRVFLVLFVDGIFLERGAEESFEALGRGRRDEMRC